MYSHPDKAAEQRDELNHANTLAEMAALHAAGYCHDGLGNWQHPDTGALLPRAQAYRQMIEGEQ